MARAMRMRTTIWRVDALELVRGSSGLPFGTEDGPVAAGSFIF